MKNIKNRYLLKQMPILPVLAVLCSILPLYLYGQDTRRAPIDINLIIDGSDAYNEVRDDVSSWLSGRIDSIVSDGDRVTVWSAGSTAGVIYSGVVNGSAERDAIKRVIREMTVSGESADFTRALTEAAGGASNQRQAAGYSYTLLISASPHSITVANANLLRYSRVEEFTNWRALVVGLNMDTRVRSAVNSFFGN